MRCSSTDQNDPEGNEIRKASDPTVSQLPELHRTLRVALKHATCQRFSKVTHLVFDADDTLWDDQGKLQDAERRMENLFDAHLCVGSDFRQKFIAIEHRNIPIIGYGFHSYLFSLAQAIFEDPRSSTLREPALEIVKDLINEFIHQPPRVFADVEHTLTQLKTRGFSLAIATRGIPGEQLEKINRSGLADFFDHKFVVPRKEVDTYQKLAQELRVHPTVCCMIGNSLKSDIKPALEAGFCAVHIPESNTWSHDVCTPTTSSEAVALSSFRELLDVFAQRKG